MIRPLLSKIKPVTGFAYFLHLGLLLLLPLIVFVLVRLNFVVLAVSIIVLSKWRMFAVRPRFWPANIRANAVDIMVGLSIVVFMVHSQSAFMQFVWALLYGSWLIFLKPATGTLMVSLQALVSQTTTLMALFLAWADGPLYGLVLSAGLICYLAAHHFFDSFDEPYVKMLSYLWGYFAAALTWLLGHWLLFYRGVPQPLVLLTAIGYGLATLYYLDHFERLNTTLKKQFVFVMIAVILIVIIFSDWGDKVV
ncbi:MAG TPA: hypothetical protein VFI84_02605 [Candidatus Saccharimonadales bacterium]|nr:hypothetical protein [Candidatus Saccharimonadales bacterium]